MATISTAGKITYVYDETSDTWHPVAGMVDPSANFEWTGDHSFANEVVINNSLDLNGNLYLDGAFNYFASAVERDTALPNPADGTFALVFVSGSVQPQYFVNGAWRLVGNNAFIVNKSASHTLTIDDAGRTLDFSSSSGVTVTIPVNSSVTYPIGTQMAFIQSGTGQISFVAGSTGTENVIINSKNGNKKTSTQYTQAIIVKKDTNTWYLFGDLTA